MFQLFTTEDPMDLDIDNESMDLDYIDPSILPQFRPVDARSSHELLLMDLKSINASISDHFQFKRQQRSYRGLALRKSIVRNKPQPLSQSFLSNIDPAIIAMSRPSHREFPIVRMAKLATKPVRFPPGPGVASQPAPQIESQSAPQIRSQPAPDVAGQPAPQIRSQPAPDVTSQPTLTKPLNRSNSGSEELRDAVSNLNIAAQPRLELSNRRREKRRLVEAENAQRKAAEEAAKEAEAARLKAEIEARWRAEQEAQLLQSGTRRIPTSSVFPPLSESAEESILEALAKRPTSQVAKTPSGQRITRRDIGKVLPQAGTEDDRSGWLNDEIIAAYLEMVVAYGSSQKQKQQQSNKSSPQQQQTQTPRLHAFNAFFFTNLAKGGYAGVKRWAKKAKIGGSSLLDVEYVFIPVNKGGNHWTLCVVSPTRRIIEYFDSFHGPSTQVTGKVKEWLAGELGNKWKPEEWSVVEEPGREGRGGGPRQNNMSDCGVFTVTTAKMIVLGVDPNAVSAADMPLQRRRMVAEILSGGFTGGFEPNITF
ncbi:MAG: hypothetical protein OHK93_005692 [Ramalina farinacea]|uniref:Ubiquitin-like protease family profile domain-containing protein n=1 Tax=Ramalina farinacea TaxID=258253 RepID=A0AA43QH59_9LECA|nr:hypothetical protein [Ramalina farinacea]